MIDNNHEVLKPMLLQRGFGLLEVLITIVVLGVSMIALTKLQGILLQEGSYAKARSAALNLAQGKLEDLRGFSRLKAAGNETFSYEDIKESPESVKIQVPNGNVYRQTWTVKSYYYCPDKKPDENNCDEPYKKPYPDFKVVTVTVKWDGLEGEQSVQLESAISASNPADEARALALLASGKLNCYAVFSLWKDSRLDLI